MESGVLMHVCIASISMSIIPFILCVCVLNGHTKQVQNVLDLHNKCAENYFMNKPLIMYIQNLNVKS